MKSVEQLDVYKIAFQLTLNIYKITESFPKSELFGLVSQMRRSAVSINSNLTEGSARASTKEYKHFVSISKGSTAELDYQIKIAHALGFIDKENFEKLKEDIERIGRMLTGLYKSLK